MIPSIDYLSLILAGACLFYVGISELDSEERWAQRMGLIIAIIATILFVLGTTRAAMSALGV